MKTVLLHGLGQTAQDWKEVVQNVIFTVSLSRKSFRFPAFLLLKTERRTEHYANQS